MIGVALAACKVEPPPGPPAAWLYPAPRPPWPQPPARGQLGGGDVPIAVDGTGLRAGPGVDGGPLAMRALVGSGDDGPAEAALSGVDGAGPAIDLVEVDRGVVRWRNRSAALPAVAIIGDRVYAAGGETVVALDRASGAEVGRYAGRWLLAGRDRAALAVDGGKVAFLDRGGPQPGRSLPGAPADLVALCDGWYLAWRGGRLERWDGAAFTVDVIWSTPAPQPNRADCGGDRVVISGGAPRAVYAFAAADGSVVGGPIAAADFWPARTGVGVELATAAGVEWRDRSLAAPHPLEPIALDHLIAARGPRRLVLADDGSPVILDRGGARSLAAPAGDPTVVAGERAFVTGPWRWPLVTQHAQPARFTWPPDDAIALPGPATPPALLGDPPRVDLPPAQALAAGTAAALSADWVGAVTFDAADPERLYVVVIAGRPDASTGAAIGAFDLHADRWRWISSTRDGCPPGLPIAMAATAGVVACAAQGATVGHGAVRAVAAADGAVRWSWSGETVDAVVGGGDAFAILAGAEVTIVDAATGVERGRWRTSDGFVPRLALVRDGADTRIASLEHGAIVIRSLALGLLPVDALAVAGRVVALSAIGDRVAVALADGSLHLLDRDGAERAAGALAPAWLPRGELAVATSTNPLGDATVVAIDADGVPRLTAALAGVTLAAVGARAAAPGAPLVVAADDGRALVLDAGGRVRALTALPGPGGPDLFATVVDGAPVAGVVLGKPLRVIRFALD